MHPTRTSTLVLLLAGVIVFVLSARGQPETFWASALRDPARTRDR
jgi:hypothetical protein